jgi:hypothetical protein
VNEGLRRLLVNLSPSARDKLRTVLIRDDRDESAALPGYGDAKATDGPTWSRPPWGPSVVSSRALDPLADTDAVEPRRLAAAFGSEVYRGCTCSPPSSRAIRPIGDGGTVRGGKRQSLGCRPIEPCRTGLTRLFRILVARGAERWVAQLDVKCKRSPAKRTARRRHPIGHSGVRARATRADPVSRRDPRSTCRVVRRLERITRRETICVSIIQGTVSEEAVGRPSIEEAQ